MSDMIHHHSASPLFGGETDAFDVIETDEISIWQNSVEVAGGFATVAEAVAEAETLAIKWDRDNMTLDYASDMFDKEPSDLTCALLLNEAANYHRDEMIAHDTFQMIVKRVANWLADEYKLGD